MKFGARILKTGVSVTLALVVAMSFGLPSPVFAGVAAALGVQPSVYRSYINVIEQIQANIIGALLSIFFVVVFGSNPLIIGIAAIFVIATILRLRLADSTISVATVTVIAIMEYSGDNFFEFAMLRFSTILIGILSAFIVNMLFIPPKYEIKLYTKTIHITDEIIRWIRVSIRNACDSKLLKDEIENIREQMTKIDHFYLLYKEEKINNEKSIGSRSRKLVLFRHCIQTAKQALHTLKLLNKLDNEIAQMPQPFRQALFNELDTLVAYHEQILLRLSGKIKRDPSLVMGNDVVRYKFQLAQLFLEQKKEADAEQQEQWLHLFPLIGTIINYTEHVEHLDTLVDSYCSFHKSDELPVQQYQGD